MKTYARFVKFVLPVALVLVIAAAFARVPAIRSWWQPAPVPVAAVKIDEQHDAAILQELITVYHRLDTVRTFYMEGMVKATDPADSSNYMNTAFSYAMDQQHMYSRLGDQEMLSLPDISLAVNHGVKKIFLSSPQKVAMPFRLSTDSLVRMVHEEGYTVKRKVNRDIVTISLLRETHISCKEYTVSFDTAYHLLRSVYMRLTDLSAPEDKKMDKTVQVTFRRWDLEHVPGELFRQQKWIRRTADGVAVAEGLPEYELIQAGNY